MAENQEPGWQKKNALDNSTVSSGRDTHIGDVNVTIHQAEKREARKSDLIAWIAVLILAAMAGYWGYSRFFGTGTQQATPPEVSQVEQKAPGQAIEKTPGNPPATSSTEKKTEKTKVAPLNNRVAGVVKNTEGAGIGNIRVTADNGRSAKTDANGYFELDLGGEAQLNNVRLTFYDPGGVYSAGDRNFIVPKPDISMILYPD